MRKGFGFIEVFQDKTIVCPVLPHLQQPRKHLQKIFNGIEAICGRASFRPRETFDHAPIVSRRNTATPNTGRSSEEDAGHRPSTRTSQLPKVSPQEP